jgi:branched-chain amino acid transport system permease protein
MFRKRFEIWVMTQQVIKAIKSSGVLGAIAFLTVFIFGGWSGTVIGWLLGTAAGFRVGQGKQIFNPTVGARLGAISGLAWEFGF